MLPFFNTAYQKLIEGSLIVLGVLGIIFYIRRDAKQEAKQEMQTETYEEFFKNDAQDKKNARYIRNLSDDQFNRLLEADENYWR